MDVTVYDLAEVTVADGDICVAALNLINVEQCSLRRLSEGRDAFYASPQPSRRAERWMAVATDYKKSGAERHWSDTLLWITRHREVLMDDLGATPTPFGVWLSQALTADRNVVKARMYCTLMAAECFAEAAYVHGQAHIGGPWTAPPRAVLEDMIDELPTIWDTHRDERLKISDTRWWWNALLWVNPDERDWLPTSQAMQRLAASHVPGFADNLTARDGAQVSQPLHTSTGLWNSSGSRGGAVQDQAYGSGPPDYSGKKWWIDFSPNAPYMPRPW
jgi:hypothetical protein